MESGVYNDDSLQTALDRAMAARYKLTTIAKESGVGYESVRQFRRDGYLGLEKRRKLEEYCRAKGFFDTAPIGSELNIDPEQVSDPFFHAILLLNRAIQAALVNGLPKSEKAIILKKQMKIIQDHYLTRVTD